MIERERIISVGENPAPVSPESSTHGLTAIALTLGEAIREADTTTNTGELELELEAIKDELRRRSLGERGLSKTVELAL